MGENVSAIEAIEKAMEGVTPGPWQIEGKWSGGYYLSTMHPSPIFELGPIVGVSAKHKANAAYIAACHPVAMREVLALARQAEALQRENAEKDADIAKLREALGDSLSSFRCTQNVDRYPADHWCRRARALLGGENAE